MTAKTLLLMDGAAMAYRAFYAIQNLSSSAGQPTNALFGFIRMANQLAAQWHPTHRAVVFDAGLPAARMALLPSYKQQRPPMPDPLRSQFPLIEEFLRCAGIPVLRVEGQEADDTMASLAALAAAEAAETLLATSDKDLLQLVSASVAAVSPVKGGVRCGPPEVAERLGVAPEQVVDWLAMAGDNADGIPGVPGIGGKTAAKLLGQFGSLMQILARLDEVRPEHVRESLRSHGEELKRNLGLVRLDTTLDCVPAWDALARQAEPFDAVVPFYNRLGFHSLTRAAQEESVRILEQAEADGEEVKRGADEYAASILIGLEGEVVRTLQGIKRGIQLLDERRSQLRGALEEVPAGPDEYGPIEGHEPGPVDAWEEPGPESPARRR